MSENDQEIQTFVILDLETIGTPEKHFRRTCIREISLCAFSAKYLLDKDDYSKVVLNDVASVRIPELPPVQNKITLMVCPSDVTDDGFEKVTGKNVPVKNYEMLKNESPFDEGTADCINNFLGHLKKPICLVAHNGWAHDFPTIRYVYEKIKKAFPSGIFCVDSYVAFREIDKKYEIIKNEIDMITGEQTLNGKHMDFMRAIVDSSQINWQDINEASPSKKRKVSEKRDLSSVIDKMRSLQKTNDNLSEKLSVKRELFVEELTLERYPEKFTYRLVDVYKRCFSGREPLNLHSAEGDVDALTRLVLYYGTDFLAYAEERKILFAYLYCSGIMSQRIYRQRCAWGRRIRQGFIKSNLRREKLHRDLECKKALDIILNKIK